MPFDFRKPFVSVKVTVFCTCTTLEQLTEVSAEGIVGRTRYAHCFVTKEEIKVWRQDLQYRHRNSLPFQTDWVLS